jgi:RNA 2',3'-cyclic 3'-phosphodiesterase
VSQAGGRWKHDGPADHPRLFVAVPLDDEAGAAVRSVIEAVRAQPLPPGMRDVRWVRTDGLHLTLAFIGPVEPERVAAVSAAVLDAGGRSEGGTGTLAGAGTFPAHGRPRTIWIGVPEGQSVLAMLAAALEPALAAAGKPRDDRPFRAHLTVARSDGLVAGRLVAGRLADALGDRRIPFRIDRLVLYESITGDGPARYRPVAEVALSGSGSAAPVYHPEGPPTVADPTAGDPGSP